MTVTCSKGTYIRSLCRDIGRKLQSGACMTKLTRTRSSGFRIEASHTLDEIEKAAKEDRVSEYIIPVEKVFSSLQKGTVRKTATNCFITEPSEAVLLLRNRS